VTDYAGPDTFEQEIYIRRVKNPLTVYLDPDIQEADGSDARFGFVFEDMPKDEFETRYPELKDMATTAPLDNDDGWITEDHVRVAEYFRREPVKDQLVAFKDPRDRSRPDPDPALGDEPLGLARGDERHPQGPRHPDPRRRSTTRSSGTRSPAARSSRNGLAGRYVPIIRVPGEETVIDGEMDRKGHVRALKDPQRMYNYNASAQVEFGALQNKIPYIAPAEAIEGYETYWETPTPRTTPCCRTTMTTTGPTDPGPEAPGAADRVARPIQLAMKNAANDMMLVSGQYQADFGAPSNERSGVAIQQRQRQGATATYHYIDHLAMAMRFAGKIIIDLIPKVYDTKRLIKIMAEDGSDSDVLLDPNAAQAFLEQQQKNATTTPSRSSSTPTSAATT
jgi:hypothetical protein